MLATFSTGHGRWDGMVMVSWESWEYEGRSMELRWTNILDTFLASFLGLLFHVEANIWVISGSIITKHRVYQWIGLKEQLQENHIFLPQNKGYPADFPCNQFWDNFSRFHVAFRGSREVDNRTWWTSSAGNISIVNQRKHGNIWMHNVYGVYMYYIYYVYIYIMYIL